MTAVGSIDGGATVAGQDGLKIQFNTWDVTRQAFHDVWEEMLRQDKKWGVQDHSLGDWQLIATEEDGEVCAAILQGRFADAEKELVQAIAVRFRMIEKVRRMEE
jgi:predicted secreted protein